LRVEKALWTPLQQDYAKYEYTPNGKRKAVTDANGNRAEMRFDGFDRQSRWTFPSNAPGQANPADYEEYGYDTVGNRTSLRKRDGSVLTYAYDNLNRVVRKTVPERPHLSAAQTRDVFYDYDAATGLQTRARFDGLDGYGVTTWYDGFGQPVTALLNMAGEARYVSYAHDEAGSRARITHPDGAAFGYAHDALGRVTTVHDHAAPASLDDYVIRYWYKPEGPRHAAVRGTGSAGFTTIFYYDALQRPEAIHNDLPPDGADVSFTFGYNRAGQIVSRTVSNDGYAAPPAADVRRGYQVNGLNQYTGTTWDGAPNWSFEHDPNGNLNRSVDPVGADSTSFVYDVENRLVSASGKANATLVYDPLGRLFEVTGATGARTRFLYDGDRMIAEYDGWGTLLKRYVHGPGADEPVAVYEGSALGLAGRRYMLPDERGSVIGLVHSSGSPSVINSYDPWGVAGAAGDERPRAPPLALIRPLLRRIAPGAVVGRPPRPLLHIVGELADEPLDMLAQLFRKAEIGREQGGRIVVEKPLAAPPGQDVGDVDSRRLEPCQVARAKLPAVVLVQALLGYVGPDQGRELGLLEAEPQPLLLEPCAEAHTPSPRLSMSNRNSGAAIARNPVGR
jgi:YD repeat-containing protein